MMQPNLLSPEKEENPPESIPPLDVTPAEPAPVSEPIEADASPTVKKKGSSPLLTYVVLGVLVVLLIAAFGWVGYWAYSLNTELTNTQQDLAALQGDYAKLQTDYAALKAENEKLNAELTQAQADLEKANTGLATVQADLAKSNDQNKSLSARFAKGTQLAEVLSAFITVSDPGDLLKLDALIRKTNNQELLAQWNKITDSPSPEGFSQFLKYLILATSESLK